VKIRWKFFVDEAKRVLPPFEVAVSDSNHPGGTDLTSSGGLRPLVMQNVKILEDVKDLVGPLQIGRPKTRKEREQLPEGTLPAKRPLRHPSRWLRRRYGVLLSKIPILTWRPRGGYIVTQSDEALSTTSINKRGGEMEQDDYAWFVLGHKAKVDRRPSN
jgi:hypothetical protein